MKEVNFIVCDQETVGEVGWVDEWKERQVASTAFFYPLLGGIWRT
jgi:hypothetical protein